MTAPVRRRPGRPRKNPLPEDLNASTEVAESPVETEERGDPPPRDVRDPRIGQECHLDATHVGFDDGSLYEAEGGYLVKRVS